MSYSLSRGTGFFIRKEGESLGEWDTFFCHMLVYVIKVLDDNSNSKPLCK